jgi:2-hydroxy-3-keto-5-methylthiopentenyl-1-phosphate phosphatase
MENQDKYYTIVKDYDGKETARVHTGMLAKSLTLDNMAELLQDYVNSGMKDMRDGEVVGKLLQTSHRTLQASVIRFCLGVIVSLGEQEYTDARNEMPVAMAKKIKAMLDNGELKAGWMI